MSDSRTTETLKVARDLLCSKGWNTGFNAADSDNLEVEVTDPYAACFCADGAIQRAVADRQEDAEVLKEARYFLYEAIPQKDRVSDGVLNNITSYNDEVIGTDTNALIWFDKAIELSQGKK